MSSLAHVIIPFGSLIDLNSYIHGIMDGEVIAQIDDVKHKYQEFRIK